MVFLSAFSVVTLAMPLGATRLYLFGISVDQQFRTEYLTRLADSPALHDMTYIGLPPFYPAGWFWIGGRLADLTGMPAWEMFKPWAIISITAAIAVAAVLWSAMLRFEIALAVSTATAAVTLAYTSASRTPPSSPCCCHRSSCWRGRGSSAPTKPPGEPLSASGSSSAWPRCSTPCCWAMRRSPSP